MNSKVPLMLVIAALVLSCDGQGEKGQKGEMGDRGAQGPAGLNGDPGENGVPGEDGRPGVNGDPGERGSKGSKGALGEDGRPGPAGVDGEPGERGPKGFQGVRGPRGEAGYTGVPGQKGAKGEPALYPQVPQQYGLFGVSPPGIQGPVGPPGPPGQPGHTGEQGVCGVIYTRWGNSSCPRSTRAQLVYAGRAGGTFFSSSGGGAEKLCLPNDPDYLPGTTGFTILSHIHGAEYQFHSGPNTNVHQHNIPCAVCYVPTRATAIMVPAKSLCPPSWTREYYGYLTTERDSHNGRSSFNCIDVNPEVIPGTSANTEGALFYYVDTTCNGLACPPYENGGILSCAVCTK